MITHEEFKEDVRTWAKEVGVAPKEIHIRVAACKHNRFKLQT